jgi:DNA-binding protein H-NS
MTEPQAKLDLAGKSLDELKQLLAHTDAAIAERRIEELKVLADGYAKKLVMNGFSVQEGMAALKPYLPTRARRRAD